MYFFIISGESDLFSCCFQSPLNMFVLTSNGHLCEINQIGNSMFLVIILAISHWELSRLSLYLSWERPLCSRSSFFPYLVVKSDKQSQYRKNTYRTNDSADLPRNSAPGFITKIKQKYFRIALSMDQMQISIKIF